MHALFLEKPGVKVLQVTIEKKTITLFKNHIPSLQYKLITYVNKTNKIATCYSQFAQLVMDMR